MCKSETWHESLNCYADAKLQVPRRRGFVLNDAWTEMKSAFYAALLQLRALGIEVTAGCADLQPGASNFSSEIPGQSLQSTRVLHNQGSMKISSRHLQL